MRNVTEAELASELYSGDVFIAQLPRVPQPAALLSNTSDAYTVENCIYFHS